MIRKANRQENNNIYVSKFKSSKYKQTQGGGGGKKKKNKNEKFSFQKNENNNFFQKILLKKVFPGSLMETKKKREKRA